MFEKMQEFRKITAFAKVYENATFIEKK
jgi:hypothetical protein